MMVTVYLTGKYAPGGQNWQIGKVISQTGFGLTIEDSRGERTTYPTHSIERLDHRNGW